MNSCRWLAAAESKAKSKLLFYYLLEDSISSNNSKKFKKYGIILFVWY